MSLDFSSLCGIPLRTERSARNGIHRQRKSKTHFCKFEAALEAAFEAAFKRHFRSGICQAAFSSGIEAAPPSGIRHPHKAAPERHRCGCPGALRSPTDSVSNRARVPRPPSSLALLLGMRVTFPGPLPPSASLSCRVSSEASPASCCPPFGCGLIGIAEFQ